MRGVFFFSLFSHFSFFQYALVLVCFIYPLVVHWGWSADGWASPWREEDLLFGCGVTDFAGSGVVHLTGGTAAFWGAFFLGPRRHRNPEIPAVTHRFVFQCFRRDGRFATSSGHLLYLFLTRSRVSPSVRLRLSNPRHPHSLFRLVWVQRLQHPLHCGLRAGAQNFSHFDFDSSNSLEIKAKETPRCLFCVATLTNEFWYNLRVLPGNFEDFTCRLQQ
jgi:hypothetical protein